MWATTLWDHSILPLQWGVVIGTSLVAAATDLRACRIPNWLTGSVFAGGLCWAAWYAGVRGVADGVAASLGMALPYVLLFLLAGGGAGDAKLMGALGVWLGVANGMVVLVSVAICGIGLAVLSAAIQRRTCSVASNLMQILSGGLALLLGHSRLIDLPQWLPDRQSMKQVRYGVAVWVGVCFAGIGVWAWRI